MIRRVTGEVAALGLQWVDIDIHGVALHVEVPPAVAQSLSIGERASLVTSMVIKEDAWRIFGFSSPDERDVFEGLQVVSGVGPKLALTIVSVLSVDSLCQAITSENVAALCAIPGVGRKSAQRLIVELKDRVAQWSITPSAALSPASSWEDPVRQALIDLGWSAAQAKDAMAAAEKLLPPGSSTAEALRSCLRQLAP